MHINVANLEKNEIHYKYYSVDFWFLYKNLHFLAFRHIPWYR